MRECHNNYAHGPMKLKTKKVVVEHRGETVTCDKLVYNCAVCGFELHEKWMEEKFQEELSDSAKSDNHQKK